MTKAQAKRRGGETHQSPPVAESQGTRKTKKSSTPQDAGATLAEVTKAPSRARPVQETGKTSPAAARMPPPGERAVKPGGGNEPAARKGRVGRVVAASATAATETGPSGSEASRPKGKASQTTKNASEYDETKPVVLVFRDPKTGKLAFKLPGKGAQWRKGYPDIGAAVQDAMKELSPPWYIRYVTSQ